MCNIIGFDLGFSRSNVEAILQEWEGRLTWNEKDVSLDPLWNLELWPRPWIFKGKFQKSCICGAGWLFDMERKGCESIGSQTHFATLNFDLIRDLDLGFLRWNFRKAVSRVGASTRNLSTSTSRCMSTSTSTVKMCEYEYWVLSRLNFQIVIFQEGSVDLDQKEYETYDVGPIMQPWTCNMGFPVGNPPDIKYVRRVMGATKLLQFPNCGSINGLSTLWWMGWGVLSFFECLVTSCQDSKALGS